MKLPAVLVLLCLSFGAFAQNAYEIKVTLKPLKNQYIYLGHYYGKQLPIIDSVLLNEKSEGIFKGSKKLGGGIYLVGYPNKSQHFEILVDKNQKFSVIADTTDIRKLTFVNSPENTAFLAYQDFMVKNGKQMEGLAKERNANKADSAKLTAQIETINKTVRKYREDIIAKEGEALLPTLLKAMREPEVPQNSTVAKSDSLFAYKYFKGHYWEGVNFYDDRLVRTPFFESRLDKYFEQLLYPNAD